MLSVFIADFNYEKINELLFKSCCVSFDSHMTKSVPSKLPRDRRDWENVSYIPEKGSQGSPGDRGSSKPNLDSFFKAHSEQP